MLDYEVLILDDKARPRAFVEMRDSDDGNAVRSAAFIANGRPFEVWRDLDCIHRPTGTVRPVEQPISRWKGIGATVLVDTCDRIGRS
ncbi:MAG TPA: hypothetical protein VGH23_13245 [Rhizomicrobium sp.]